MNTQLGSRGVPRDALRVFTTSRDGLTTVRVMGDIDTGSSCTLADALAFFATHDAHTREVDLSEVNFIDSTGLGVLVKARAALSGDDPRIRVINASATVRRVLELSGLSETFGLLARHQGE